jgi:DNA-binding response OmpR family regulator
LSARETDLLAYFMSRPEEVVARERILEDVWGDEAEDDSNVVNVYVNYLRNKLERSEYSRLIHTVRGVGYVLAKDEPRGMS